MHMKRRTFFKGLLGIAAAPAVVKALPAPVESRRIVIDSEGGVWGDWKGKFIPPDSVPIPPPESLTAMQQAVLESGADEIFIGTSRGVGKTYAMLRWMIQGALRGGSRWRGLVFVQHWPSMDDAICKLANMSVKMGPEMNTPRIFVSRSEVEFPNGSKVRFAVPDQIETFRGWDFNRAAFDLNNDTPRFRTMIRSERMLSVVNRQGCPIRTPGYTCHMIDHSGMNLYLPSPVLNEYITGRWG